MSEKKGDDEMLNKQITPQTQPIIRRVATNEEAMAAAAQEMKKFSETLKKLAKN